MYRWMRAAASVAEGEPALGRVHVARPQFHAQVVTPRRARHHRMVPAHPLVPVPRAPRLLAMDLARQRVQVHRGFPVPPACPQAPSLLRRVQEERALAAQVLRRGETLVQAAERRLRAHPSGSRSPASRNGRSPRRWRPPGAAPDRRAAAARRIGRSTPGPAAGARCAAVRWNGCVTRSGSRGSCRCRARSRG